VEEIEAITKLKSELADVQKEGKQSNTEARTRLFEEMKKFE
jgi:hypothetical protein